MLGEAGAPLCIRALALWLPAQLGQTMYQSSQISSPHFPLSCRNNNNYLAWLCSLLEETQTECLESPGPVNRYLVTTPILIYFYSYFHVVFTWMKKKYFLISCPALKNCGFELRLCWLGRSGSELVSVWQPIRAEISLWAGLWLADIMWSMTVLYFLKRNAGGFSYSSYTNSRQGMKRPANCNEACCLSREQIRQGSPLTVGPGGFLEQRDPAARYLFIFVNFLSLIMRWQMHVMVGWESVSVKAVLEWWETGGGRGGGSFLEESAGVLSITITITRL